MHATELDEDGGPVWTCTPGTELPGGFIARERLAVGRCCETWLVWSIPMWAPAVRALREDSARPLPPYLKPLLGGMANLRGFKAGRR